MQQARHFPPRFDENAIRRFVVGKFGQFGLGQAEVEGRAAVLSEPAGVAFVPAKMLSGWCDMPWAAV